MRSLVGTHAGGLDRGLLRAPVPVALWVRDGDSFVCVDVNETMCTFSGRPRADFIGATIADLGGNAARAKRDMLEATSTGKTVQRDRAWVLPSGEVRELEVAYVGLGPTELLAFVHDVTLQRAAEQRRRLTEDRYQTLVATANQGVWLVGPDGATVFANTHVAHILDRPMNEILQGNLLDFVDPHDRPSVAGALECPRDTPNAFEARFRRRDGTELLCLLGVSPMPGEEEKPETLCVLADMTKVQHERELRMETERRYRRMVETATEGVWTGDREGRTTFVNDAGARMLGIDREEMLGKPFTDYIVYDDRAMAARAKIRHDGVPIHGEYRLRRPSGGHIDVIASVSLLRGDGGEVIGSLAMITDITQMKWEQAELAESRQRFAQVFNEAPVGMVFIGAGHLVRGRFLAANSEFCHLLGYSDAELMRRDIFSVTHPEDVEEERALASALFEHQREEYALDKRFVRADGSVVWARFRAHVLRDEHGAPLYALGLAVDISAEREATEHADGSAARVRALLESARDAVLEIAGDGTIVAVNDAALLLFGVQRTELIGQPLDAALVPERLRMRVVQALEDWFRAATEGTRVEPTETTLQRVDGSEFPAEVQIAAVPQADVMHLLLHVRNLGIRDSAVAARREADERFERLFRDSPVAAVSIDVRGRLTDVNPAFCKLAGREPPSLIGREAVEVLADAGDAAEPPWQSSERPGPLTAARRLMRADGAAVAVRITASLVRDAAGAPLQWLCQCAPQAFGVASPDADGEELSYRERQVLGLLAQGHDGPAIAERLGLSPETVRSYANTAREKLGAKTRTEAVALALVRGEISV